MTADQKAVISRLKDSLELHTIKRDFLIYLVFFGLMYLLSVPDDSGAATLIAPDSDSDFDFLYLAHHLHFP